jgi:hypothetical protein
MEPVKGLFIVSTLPILMAGCGLASDRDIRAYNTCLSRHAQEAAICDGPRQAYEVGDFVLQANLTRVPIK